MKKDEYFFSNMTAAALCGSGAPPRRRYWALVMREVREVRGHRICEYIGNCSKHHPILIANIYECPFVLSSFVSIHTIRMSGERVVPPRGEHGEVEG
jgi:hypothetical protein